MNVAVAFFVCVSVTAHVPVPLHAPLQPANLEPEEGVAVNVTAAPLLKAALHVDPQLMAEGVEVTAPEPRPRFFTVRE